MSWQDRPYADGGSGGGRGFSQNPMSWAPSLGTVFGIRVQVHILFLIFIAIELLRGATGGGFWWALRYEIMLFGLVFLHELGHCFGARSVGGSATNILMWPLGGLAYVGTPHRPGANLWTAAAGPLVNFAFCVITGTILIAATGSLHAVPWNPFHSMPHESTWPLLLRYELFFWLYQFFYVNYILMLFNVCLPVFPLDGGRIFQALCWHRMGYHRSMMLATTVGMVGSILLGCFGLFVHNFMLIGIAVFAYLTTLSQRRTLAMAGPYGEAPYDYGASQTEPAPPRRSRWREGAWARKQKKLVDEQADVDRILAKVHEQGMASLTRKEKKTLAQATKQQQNDERRTGRIDRL